jgi:hypothetical protein
MPDKPTVPAPFIYFEGITSLSFVNGIGKIAIEAGQIVAAPDGGTSYERVPVAHLVGNIEAIRRLREAIDGILLMAEPTSEGHAN